jgi:S-DNA-T family DNA segregation ATPase FtsK/SpoIIIE
MFGKDEINKLREEVIELSVKLDKISDRQNSQFTDLMMQLKEARDEIATSHEQIREDYEGDGDGIDDSMYETAKSAVIEAGKASTSYIQRKLGITYSRASKIIDTLEEEGVIGPAKGSTPREVIAKQ